MIILTEKAIDRYMYNMTQPCENPYREREMINSKMFKGLSSALGRSVFIFSSELPLILPPHLFCALLASISYHHVYYDYVSLVGP